MFSRRGPLHQFTLNACKIPSQRQFNALVVAAPCRRQDYTLTKNCISNIEGTAMCRVVVDRELTKFALKILPRPRSFPFYIQMKCS